MSEKLLNESTIKRFMKLANLSPMSNSFLEEGDKKVKRIPQDIERSEPETPSSTHAQYLKGRELSGDHSNSVTRDYAMQVKAGKLKITNPKARANYDKWMDKNKDHFGETPQKNESVEPLEEEEIKRKVFTKEKRPSRLDIKKAASGEHGKRYVPGKPVVKKVVGIQDPEQQMTVPVTDPGQTRDLPDASENLQRESVFNSDYILQETLKRVILNLKGSK